MSSVVENLDKYIRQLDDLAATTSRDGFALGDVVELKSGGDPFTVIGFGATEIRCAVSAPSGFRDVYLRPETLRKIEETK